MARLVLISNAQLGLALLVALLLVFLARSRFAKRGKEFLNAPPIIAIPERDIFKKPREAYESAIAQHGPVIAVRRKGRLEYIVDENLTHEVLTTNTAFSFEEGTAYVLNLHLFHKLFTAFFVELDDLVRNVIITRMPLVVERVFPAFMRHADALMHNLNPAPSDKQERRYVDALDLTHSSISEAMAIVILGPEFGNPSNLKIIEKVAHDIAVVTGIYQNTSWWGTTFPNTWRLFTWLKVLCTTIPLYYSTIGFQIWKKFHSERYNPEEAKENPEIYKGSVLDYLACRNANAIDEKVGFVGFMRISALALGIIFASVHQTASVVVWILYELALRPEYLPILREELFESLGVDCSTDGTCATYDALQNAVRLDSFIREVMRTKGDTLSTCRLTTTDLEIAGYSIPKGFPVIPLASLSHMNPKYHGPDAEQFNGNRWVETGKQAVMINDTYFPFGLGRWACPGRVFAVAEIKMIIWAIICRATPVLKDDAYSVPDPLNVTSVSPKGEMTLIPYTQ